MEIRLSSLDELDPEEYWAHVSLLVRERRRESSCSQTTAGSERNVVAALRVALSSGLYRSAEHASGVAIDGFISTVRPFTV